MDRCEPREGGVSPTSSRQVFVLLVVRLKYRRVLPAPDRPLIPKMVRTHEILVPNLCQVVTLSFRRVPAQEGGWFLVITCDELNSPVMS
jgi:hypothetical protein